MEAALEIAALVTVLVGCLAGINAVSMQVRCVDAARLAARGDERSALAAVRRIAPGGSRVQVRREGDFLVATVVAHSKVLPALDISANAVSAAEPSG